MNETAARYKMLSLCFHDPQGPIFSALKEVEPFRESLRDATEEELRSEYTRLLSLTVAGGIPPYETEYGHKDIFFKTQRLADIAGFYRAFGLDLEDEAHERVDFIGAELEFLHWLTLKEERAREKKDLENEQLCLDARKKFLQDHLGRWAAFFGDEIARATRHPFYRELGRHLLGFIESECRRLGAMPERVAGWNPEPISTTEFECGPASDSEAPRPLTILKG